MVCLDQDRAKSKLVLGIKFLNLFRYSPFVFLYFEVWLFLCLFVCLPLLNSNYLLLMQKSVLLTVALMGYAWVELVGVKKAGLAHPAIKERATLGVLNMELVKMGSVNAAKDGMASTAPLVGWQLFNIFLEWQKVRDIGLV